MNFTDLLTMDGGRRTSDGFLVADVRVARSGIQKYRGSEVGRADLSEVRVYRPADEVFAKDALHSYAHRPVTLGHPTELVTPGNWRDAAVGHTGDEVARDGDFVRVPMLLMDETAIAAVDGGVRQLSMGYTAELEWTDGVAPDGQAYDAIQRNLRMNHLAVVAAARGGSDLKIGDDEGGPEMAGETNRSIVVDGVPVTLPEQSAAIVEKALKDAAIRVSDAEKAAADAAAASVKELAARDAEIAKRDATIDELKAKVIDADALDAKVAERAALVDSARKIVADFDPKGMADSAIKRAVVVAKVGDGMKDKPEAYIDARFDMLVETSATDGGGADPLRAGIAGATVHGDASVKAYDEMTARARNAWQGETKGAN